MRSKITKASNDWIRWELRQSLRALAASGSEALGTVEDGTAKADELALDFYNWCGAALGKLKFEFNDEQAQALRAVNDELASMSGTHNSVLWTENAVIQSKEWQHIRSLASRALTILRWEGAPLSWSDYRKYRDEHELPA